MSNAFDDTAKTRYRDYFQQRGLRAIPQYEVFSRSRATDLFVECNEEERQTLQGTVFDYFQLINAIEFKGNNDPLTTSDFNLIMMRAWGIGVADKSTKQKKKSKEAGFLHIEEIADLPTQRTVTIICVQRPRKVLDTLQNEFHFKPTDESGIYCDYAQKVPARIIYPTELPLEPRYYPLLPLARGEKLEQFIALCFDEGLVEYLQLTLEIGLATDPDMIWRELMEAYGMQTRLREDTWPYIDEFFRAYPEEMRKLPSMKEAFEAKEEAEKDRERANKAKQEADKARLDFEKRLVLAQQNIQEYLGRIQEFETRTQREAERIKVAEALAKQEAERAKQEAERVKAAEALAKQEAERVLDEKQHFLIRLLHHQFEQAPDNIIALIEDTTDLDLLDQWLDQAFGAQSWEDMNITTEGAVHSSTLTEPAQAERPLNLSKEGECFDKASSQPDDLEESA